MGMIPRYSELRALSDEELISRYDKAAENSVVGTGFYRDELFRREQERQVQQMIRFTKQLRNMTIAIVFLTVANIVLVAVTVLG